MAPLGNPDYPCIAGGEILPIASVKLPVDLGTRYDFLHTVRASAAGSTDGRVTAGFDLAGVRQQHTMAFELWLTGDEVANDTVTTAVLPLRKVTKGATAAIIGGGTALAALSSAGGAYIQMDATLATSWVQLWFQPAALTSGSIYDWSRVVRVGLRYLAWKDDSAAATPGEGLAGFQHDTTLGTNFRYGNWLVPDYQRNAQYVTKWFGETNHMPPIPSTGEWEVYPFAVTELKRMESGDETLFFSLDARIGYDSSQTTTYLDYVEMVVEIAQERRAAVANRLISNLAPRVVGADYGPTTSGWVDWRWSRDPSALFALTAADYTATVREALPASASDQLRAAPSGAYGWSYPEAIGPSMQLLGVSQARATQAPQLETRTATISGGVVVGAVEPLEDYNLGLVAYDEATRVAAGPFWAAYETELVGAEIKLTYLADINQAFTADGVTAYRGVQVMCRPDPLTTEGVIVNLEKPLNTPLATVTLSAAAVRALPDVGGGWRIVSTDFSFPAFAVTPTAGTAYITAALSNPGSTWFIAGAELLEIAPGASAAGAALYSHQHDSAMVALCALANPPTPFVEAGSAAPVASAACGVESIAYAHLEWTVDTDAAVYAVQRSTDDATWTTIVYLLTADVVAGGLSYDDMGAPWDVPVYYRLIAYRAADLTAMSGGSASVTLSSGGAVLGLSSATSMMIYVPASESDGLSMSWTDLSPVDYVQLAGEDFARALRGPEDRGLSVTIPVLIAGLAACADAVPDPLSVAQRSLDPTPWDLVRIFAREHRLDVRFPGGHVRVMSMSLSGMVARTVHGVYLAELVLTDVHTEIENPLDGI